MREFLAIALPDDLRAVLARAARGVAPPAGGWRPMREESLHATIRFLGEVEDHRQRSLEAAVRLASAGTGLLRLRLRGASLLPSSRAPRVLAFLLVDETADGALALLADRVELAARGEGFAAEPHRFSGHVTVARARRGLRVAIPDFKSVGELGAFVSDRLILFCSELDRGGARYREIVSFPLAGEPGS